MYPIINDHQTISILTKIVCDARDKRYLERNPKRKIPSIEWEIKRCPPKKGDKIFPKSVPAGNFLHKSAVGWSISGVSPPTKFAVNAIIVVPKEMWMSGCVATI